MATLRPGSRLHPDVEAAIREFGLEGLSPAQIERRLHEDRRLRSLAPDRRTIQRAARFYRLEDQTEAWSLGTADPSRADDAAFVLDAIAGVLAETGERPRVTTALADWIVRVRRARPDLMPAPGADGSPSPAWRSRVVAAYHLARRYLWHSTRGMPTDRLDEELATLERVGRVRVESVTVPPGSRIVGGKRDRAAERRMSQSMQRRADALQEEDGGTSR